MDHVRLHPPRLEPARQPEAVAAGFEGKRNPRDSAAGPDRLIPPAVQHRNQPFRARVQLLARLTLNPGKHTGNQPARLAQLDDGNDRAILVQGDEGSAQSLPRRRPGSFGWGIAATPSVRCSDEVATFPRRPPHSIFRFLVGSTPPDALPTGPRLPRPTCWIQFAVDSLLEGDGFELPVPQQIRSRFRESSHFSHDGLTASRPGTGSSNP